MILQDLVNLIDPIIIQLIIFPTYQSLFKSNIQMLNNIHIHICYISLGVTIYLQYQSVSYYTYALKFQKCNICSQFLNVQFSQCKFGDRIRIHSKNAEVMANIFTYDSKCRIRKHERFSYPSQTQSSIQHNHKQNE